MEPANTKHQLQSLIQSNQIAKAYALGLQLCQADPSDAEAWFLLAAVQAYRGAFEEVVACCGRALSLRPDHVGAHYNLGVALQTLRRLQAAEQSYRTALALDPGFVAARLNLGLVLLDLGRAEEAAVIYEQLLDEPTKLDVAMRVRAHINLGQVLLILQRFDEAERICRAALSLDPRSGEALNNLGRALMEQGRLQEAVDVHRQAVDVRPDFTTAHSNLLLELNYLSDPDGAATYAEHRRWARMHAEPVYHPRPHDHARDPERRLRVGYVSADFRAHSVALFFAPLLATHDRARFEVYCYSNVGKPDGLTEMLSSFASQWRTVRHLSDAQLDAMIREDRIDILVDLAGHTGDHRLLTFARKPAPVQVTWLGYPNTTGMDMMDFRLTDAWADPPGASDALHSEALIRLPRGFLCYQPFLDSPPVSDLPARHAGHITFGCFNNSAKVNPQVINVWSDLLLELPDARLRLKSAQLRNPVLQEAYRAQFARCGVDPGRIEMLGFIESTTGHLALYQGIDIALDPFPYNGTTTTCEALWMGVPVVVLEGNRHAGRVGVSLLNNIGLPELIAKTHDEYLRLASELARDTDRLAALRAGLRQRLQASPLLDRAGFTREVESAFRNMWVRYCAKNQ